ncbi:unnamed protein product [Calypogeia fissa]
MPIPEEEDESGHFRPDAWRVAWEAAQDVPAPSCEVKAAAERLVAAEHLQQALGWLLLTQIGILLGSFGQVMSEGVCLLLFAIFMVEAVLKYLRTWVHTRFFMDVPCAFVPIHQERAYDSLKVFGRYLLSAALLELLLYVPFIYVVVDFSRNYYINSDCNPGDPGCPQVGTNLLVFLLFICTFTTIGHWVTSLLTVLAFYFAMGRGIVSLIRNREKEQVNFTNDGGTNPSIPCNCSGKRCKVSKRRLSMSRTHFDRVLCLTWWVHMARHRHLSAMVASAQPGSCGLPGHWFESVSQLMRIVNKCLFTGAGDHVLNSTGPLWVSQEMALRALVIVAKQPRDDSCKEILQRNGFDLLVQVVREGKGSTSRGLAAAAIAVLATKHKDMLRDRGVDLSLAVTPLRRLLRYKEHELKEVALGALLNTALTDDEEQFRNVLSQFHSSDGVVGGSRGSFMETLMDIAQNGPTTTCQELAIGLLARLAADSPQARTALMGPESHDKTKRHRGIEFLIELLQDGQTTEIKASAAGALSELAFKEGRTIGRGPFGESCIKALIEQLRGDPRIAYASTRALCNLAIKCEENKPRIVSAGGIECFIRLLSAGKEPLPESSSRTQGRRLSPGSNSHVEMQEEVQREAARALWMLAYNNKENQERIAEAKGIPLLAELLTNDRQRVYIQAVAALSSLAWKNRKNQDLIGQEGNTIFRRTGQLLEDMERVRQAAKVPDRMEGKVLEKVALAISSFADENKPNRQNLRDAGALRALQTIEKDAFYNDKALKRVRQAIESLTGNDPA